MRGLEKRHEQDPRLLLRDTRTLGMRIRDFFKEPNSVAVLISMMAALAFLSPATADFCGFFATIFFFICYLRKATLPFRLPMRSHLPDYNDPLPGSHKPRFARGIAYFGNALNTNEELWFNNDDMRTHVLMFGSTGSGKTEALVSLSFNALMQGSGFIYVDGKGDNTLFSKIFSMARLMGREDDLLLINFMTGARDVIGPQEKRLSNTMNPFANGSSSMLSQLVVSLMESGSASGDGDMWKGRAINFVEALMKILVYMRDAGHLLLDANTVRNYFILERLEAMVIDKMFIRDNQEPVDLSGVPDVVLEPLKNYVINLPGYDRSKKGRQVSQVLEQHGFITMQLTRVFGSLADTYGHIMRTNLAEVDMKDVVLNRRILVVLLPALEKSPDELANLGKVIVASLKAMMAAGLGDTVEGDYREVILRKPTNAPTPFLCILDEYGYYAVKGFAVVPAQARSLGFSAVFAGQDLPAFQKASKEEAASIGANTNIKICLKLEDPIETWEFFSKTAGEAYVTKVDSFQTNAESLTNTYMDTRSSSAEKRARIDLLDLKDQREGEGHIFFKSQIIRYKTFYANPAPVKYMRLNHFLRVEPPKSRVLADLAKRLSKFQQLLDSEINFGSVPPNEEIQTIANVLNKTEPEDSIERGVSALIAYHNREPMIATEEATEQEQAGEETEDESHLNVFTKIRILDVDRPYLQVMDLEKFGRPLLAKNATSAQVELMERVAGKTEKHANSIASEIVKDMQLATHYPPEIIEQIKPTDLAKQVQQLAERIQVLVQEKADNTTPED
jgi:intracellular multiplication protein IcmO